MTYSADQAAPAQSWRAVTPSNTTNLPAGVRGLWVGAAGDISLVGSDGVAVTFTVSEENAGKVLPLAPRRVNATGTNATGIVALY